MSVSGALRQIADLIDDIEAAGYTVTGLTPTGDDVLLAEDSSVDLRVHGPLLDDIEIPDHMRIEPRTATLTEEGALAIEFAVTTQEPGPSPVDPAEPPDSPTSDESDAAEVPAHRDPEKLQAVYEAHDTFEAMKEALDTDVTAQTVRRNMIKHGIHDPEARRSTQDDAPETAPSDTDGTDADDSTNSSGSTADKSTAAEEPEAPASETPLTDGIDLPTETTLDDIKHAVSTAKTVHDVQRQLEISRDRTRRLLRELNLLDLVSGRIVEDQPVTREEINRRIERAAPPGA